MNTTTQAAVNYTSHVPGIPLNVTLHSWAVPNTQEDRQRPQHNDTRSTWTPRGHDIITGRGNYTTTQNLNATGYIAIEEEVADQGLTDVQTLVLAGFATLVPLLLGVVIGFVIKYLYRRYKDLKTEGYEGVLTREESSDPLGKNSSHMITHEIKTSESEFTVTPGDEPMTNLSPQVLTPKSNGSLITMTLKNNHLIVETEETTDTLNGTKMESQGTITKYVTTTTPEFVTKTNTAVSSGVEQSCSQGVELTNHGALVHQPPKELQEHKLDRAANTGLSQSDLSVSSTGSHNPSYRYGNQTEYDAGGYGYQEYCGYTTADVDVSTNNTGPEPHRTISRIMLERGDSIVSSIDVNSPLLADVLMSDVEARDRILHPKEIQVEKKGETVVLGNGELSTQNGDDIKTNKLSRCQQLKNEKSPLSEVEGFPTTNKES